jgi:flavin reductase (DIM6/NTAB) family NADH-FMN oxidoreductase RutF
MDPQAKKTALRAINYGLYVVTAAQGDQIAGATINWLTQASFAPPLVVAGLKDDSHTRALAESSGSFAVNVLAEDQLEIGSAFFRPATQDGELLNGYRFERGPITGAPLLEDVPYWFEARVLETVARGDHTIFVAEVVGAGVRDEARTPLLLRATGLSYGG